MRSRVNLGVLAEDKVNIIVHGHEPTLSEMLAVASQDEELLAYARSKGAAGINIAGICCTANEVLMRHGLPIAGNFLQQELAILTGAVEMMIVDVQCVMPSLAQVAKCFHTKLVSTSEIAQSVDAEQITFDVEARLRARLPPDPRRPSTTSSGATASACTFPRSRWNWWRASPTRPSSTCWAGASAAPSAR